jgi:hypothetical protein
VPEVLDHLCIRAMATDPAARYQRALELAQDIQRWLDENPLRVPPRTAMGRLNRWLRNHAPWIVAALVGIILTLTAALVAKMLSHETAPTAPPTTAHAPSG